MPHTLLFDRSDRVRLRLSGPQAVSTLNGLVTNDVTLLTAGQGQYAAVLTAKGKIVADLRIFLVQTDPPSTLLIDTSARAGGGLREMFAKYVNPRFTKITDSTNELRDLGVVGERAADIVAAATGVPLDVLKALEPYAHITTLFAPSLAPSLDTAKDEGGDGAVLIARAPDVGMEGYDIFVPAAQTAAMGQSLLSCGAVSADAEVANAWRVETGWPEWGIDMDDSTLPQEANFDELHAISYAKGCYIGQETVARIHFRGHVNRTLRRLQIDDVAPREAPIDTSRTVPLAGPQAVPFAPPRGTELRDAEDRVVGDIRSTAHLSHNRVVGLGMVRREIDTGASLTARWDGGQATIAVLGPAIGNTKGAID